MIREGMFIEDRYEILEKIGMGGMSVVYKAKCHKLNRYVAIKFLKPEYCEDKSFVQKFQIEAQSAAALLHPNVVSVYDVNEYEGTYYIVMEYVDGITLKQYIDRNGALPMKEATSIAIQVCQGIEAAHAAGIIHRDIKPQNVLISREGKIKVTDFGIARTTTANTISQDVLGSVHYISPEQARGGQVDSRSDIYSFGIVYYEMVTGELPFDGDSTVSIALKHIQESVPLVGDIVPNVPMSVEKIIEKCTQKKPERRYQKISSLISDLKTSLISPNEDIAGYEPEMQDNATVLMSAEDAQLLRAESPRTIRNKHMRSDEYDDYNEYDEYDDLDDEIEYIDDYEQDNYRAKKMDRKKFDKILLICGIIAGVIIIGVLAFVCIRTFSSGSGCGGTSIIKVEVPSVINMTKDDAVKTLKDKGFKTKIEYKSSDTVKKDYVIAQSIKNGEKAKEGDTIVLTVSSGNEPVILKDYTGLTQAEAESELKKLGLKVKITTEYSEELEVGKIIKTNPAANTQLTKDDTVELIISRGKETKKIKTPLLTGYTENDAKNILIQLNLEYKVYYDDSQGTKGQVISQNPKEGSEVEEGSIIEFTVSTKEPETETEPPTEPAP